MRLKLPFNGCAVKFSPFLQNRLAVATSQNFGIVGNGRLHILEVTPGTPLSPAVLRDTIAFDTADGVYDCCWSEDNENIVLAACGDGSVKVYDLGLPPTSNPLRSLHEHNRECCCVAWNYTKRDLFLSSGWDDTVKLWTFGHPGASRTFAGHEYCVYQAAWNPAHADVFLSASGDKTVRIWDCRQAAPSLVMRPHQFEVLTADWNKYNDCVIATGSVDKTIKLWDVRQPQQELLTLLGHGYPVRKVQFSPHSETLLASGGYDMTVRLWDTAAVDMPQVRVWEHHSEFVQGLDWSVLQEGLLASTGWDEQVAVWHHTATP